MHVFSGYRAGEKEYSHIDSKLWFSEPQIHLGITGEFVAGFPIWLIPGSQKRAKNIYDSLDEKGEIVVSGRDLFSAKGYLYPDGKKVPVGIATSGMGTSSLEITIFRELAPLAILFNSPDYPVTMIRVGSSGNISPDIYAGDLVNADSAYAFDGATSDLIDFDPRFAIASDAYTVAVIQNAAQKLGIDYMHMGPVISKGTLTSEAIDSLPLPLKLETENKLENRKEYLVEKGVLASEMEQALLNATMKVYNNNYGRVIRTGGIMAVVNHPRNPEDAMPNNPLFAKPEVGEFAEQRAIELALKTAELLYIPDTNK